MKTITNLLLPIFIFSYNNLYAQTQNTECNNVWTGKVSSTWGDPGNWSCNLVPDENAHVVIDSGNIVVTENASCGSLTLKQGVMFDVMPGVTFTTKTPDDPLAKGLIAYYPFNSNANDQSGNNYHLTVNEAVLDSNRFGESSKAYTFNGSSSYLKIPKLLKADSLREFTISLWAKAEESKSQSLFSFFANPEATFCSNSSSFLYTNTQFLLYHEIVSHYSTYSCNNTSFYDTITNAVGKWSHVLLIQRYNTTNPLYNKYDYVHYFNGQQLKSGPGTRGLSNTNPLPVKFSLGGIFGRDIGPVNYFSGSLDDIRIYNRALSEDEIQKLYNLPKE